MSSRVKKTASGTRKVRIYVSIGVAVLLILLATLAIAGQKQTLRCDRSNTGTISCIVRKSILGIITLNSKTTAGAHAITIGEQCSGSDCKYRLELYTDQGVVPVTDQYTSNYDQLLDVFSRFNTFFTNQTNTNMQISVETKPILIVGIVVVCVLIWIYLGYLSWQARRTSR